MQQLIFLKIDTYFDYENRYLIKFETSTILQPELTEERKAIISHYLHKL